MSDRITTWNAVFLLDHQANRSAQPDKVAKGYFRHEEVMLGSSELEIVRALRARDAIVIDVKEAPQPHPLFNRVTNEYRQQILMALMFNVQGGMSPGKALETLIEQERGPLRARLNIGLSVLRQGRSFLEAIRSIELFDETTLAIVEAGEEMGKLPEALDTAYKHLEKNSSASKLIVGAVLVTSIDLLFSVTSIIGTRFGMIPSMRESGPSNKENADAVADFERALGLATMVNDIMLIFTFAFIVALVICFIGYFGRDEEFRKKIDAILIKLPMVKDLLIHSAVSSTSAVMSSLLKGGVTFMPAALITARGTKLSTVANYWSDAYKEVELGEPISRSLGRAPMSDNEQMIIVAHKDMHQLATTFDLISTQREEKAKKSAKRFAGAVFLGSLFYSGLSVGVTLLVVYVQNKGVFGG